jgi:hypothetical protein
MLSSEGTGRSIDRAERAIVIRTSQSRGAYSDYSRSLPANFLILAFTSGSSDANRLSLAVCEAARGDWTLSGRLRRDEAPCTWQKFDQDDQESARGV